MNKFEQVCSDQMSLVVGDQGQGQGSLSDVQREIGLYSEVQFTMGNGHMGTLSLMTRQTDMTENITFPQLHLR